MRMSQYFLFGSVAAILALLVAAGLGFSGDLSLHFKVALPAAILTVGAHTLLILFMMITGRILREAIRCRDLPQEFLDELNLFRRPCFRSRYRPDLAACSGSAVWVVSHVLLPLP